MSNKRVLWVAVVSRRRNSGYAINAYETDLGHWQSGMIHGGDAVVGIYPTQSEAFQAIGDVIDRPVRRATATYRLRDRETRERNVADYIRKIRAGTDGEAP